MAQIVDYNGCWKLDRHKRKKLISRSDVPIRAAKLFARQPCDDFANHKTACCWMVNDTLADHFDVDGRTLQRHLKAVKAAGFINEVKIWPNRRALQLVFAKRIEGDIEGDSKDPNDAKLLSSNHGRNVVPSYIEPKKNLKRDLGVPKKSTPHRCVHVSIQTNQLTVDGTEFFVTIAHSQLYLTGNSKLNAVGCRSRMA